MTPESRLPLSIQLYSLRAELDQHFEKTMRTLAAIGFQAVEFAGKYGGLEPARLADFLTSIGIRASGLHAMPGGLAQLQDPKSDTYRYAQAMGCKFVSLSMNPTPENFSATVQNLRDAHCKAADQGLTLTYHNHYHEFQRMPDGRTLLDALREETDDLGLQFQLDVFFAFCAGIDPCDCLKRFAGRTPQIHFNDLEHSAQGRTDSSAASMQHATELGTGCINLPAIYRTAVKTGVRWIVLEQHTSRKTALESARINFEYYQAMTEVK